MYLNLPPHDRNYWSRVKGSLYKDLYHKLGNYGTGLYGTLILEAIRKYREDYGFLNKHSCHKNLQSAINGYQPVTNYSVLFRSLIMACQDINDSAFRNISFLRKGSNGNNSLTDRQCFVILANAFFCTFKVRDNERIKYASYPAINFIRLFEEDKPGSPDDKAKVEKLKCLLAYFDIVVHNSRLPNVPVRTITFQRMNNRTKVNWCFVEAPLGQLEFSSQPIEESKCDLHVDFANKKIGGGTLGKGIVQEEIRFITCPELIVAQLFTEELDENEVVFVSGFHTFTKSSGYSTSFRFAGRVVLSSGGLLSNSIVAMDALMFKSHDQHTQYRTDLLNRELHKCQVAFGNQRFQSVASGAWGCGAFGGNLELKLLIQWMAASLHNKRLALHQIDTKTSLALNNICNQARQMKMTVGNLYLLISKFSPAGSLSLTEYITREMCVHGATPNKLCLIRPQQNHLAQQIFKRHNGQYQLPAERFGNRTIGNLGTRFPFYTCVPATHSHTPYPTKADEK